MKWVCNLILVNVILFLKTGITFACFSFSGCVPEGTEILNILLKGVQIILRIIGKIFEGIPLGPVALVGLCSLINNLTSPGSQGSTTNELLRGLFRNLSNVFSTCCLLVFGDVIIKLVTF